MPARHRSETRVVPVGYIAVGLLLGLAYAVLNSLTDKLVHDDPLVGGVSILHGFVDHGVPLAIGALAGVIAYRLHVLSGRAREGGKRALSRETNLPS
jgi:hypothetical protein